MTQTTSSLLNLCCLTSCFRRWVIASAALASFSVLTAAGAASATSISFPDRDVNLPGGSADAEVLLTIEVQGTATGAADTPKVQDLGLPGLPTVVNPLPAVGSQSVRPGVRDWYFKLALGKVPPKLTQERYLKVEAGGASETFPYNLTNQSFSWAVKLPSPAWRISGSSGRTLPVGLVQGPANQVRVAFCRLDDGKSALFDCRRLQLYVNSTAPCGDRKLCAGFNTLYLKLDDAYNKPGIYTGNVYLAANTRPDPEAVPLEISYTSWLWKLLGVAIIAMGVAIGWFLTTYARTRLARDRAQFAVADLRVALEKLSQELENLPQALAQIPKVTKKAINDLLEATTTQALDDEGFLPTVTGGAGDQPRYQVFLNDTSANVAMLKTIVEAGMLVAITKTPTPTPADPEPITRAFREFDALNDEIQPPNAGAASLRVQAILATIEPPPAGLAGASGAPAPTREGLRIDIERLGWASWLAWLLITVLVGYLTQVNKAGFGTTYDLIFCLLWGIGFPSIGTQLTPTNIATTLKVPTL